MGEPDETMYCRGYGREEHFTDEYITYIGGEVPYCDSCLENLVETLQQRMKEQQQILTQIKEMQA